MLSDTFSEGKLKDLGGPFPPDQPTELDDRDFLDGGDLEEVEEDGKLTIKIPDITLENRKSPLKSPVLGPRLTSLFSFGSMSGVPSACATWSMDPGTRLGKVVVLRDISFVT